MGVSGNVNQFQGDVEPGTFTLIELAVACPPLPFDPVELIGVALSRDRANSGPNFGDGKTRIHVEYFTQGGGPGYSGNRKGGWDLKQVGFVPYPARPYDPGVEVKASLFGVGKQQEHRLDIFQAGSGDWWIAHNGNLLGHYPANLFKMLNGGACWAAWYGEVYDETPTQWTWTDMGSGEPDLALGYGYLSYVRNPMFRDYIYSPWSPVDCGDPKLTSSCWVKPADPACYTRSPLLTYTAPWNLFFYLTGDGSDSMGCY
jgi:hypothetical protein